MVVDVLMIDASREYIAGKVLSASPMELIRILYETALDSVNKAIFYLHSGDILERGRAITKANEAIAELKVSLRPVDDNNYSKNLEGLYAYMERQLFKAHVEKSEAILNEVSRLLTVLLEGWTSAMKTQQGSDEQMEMFASEPVTQANPSTPYQDNSPATVESGRSWQF
jgi:flagellar protein FliS